MDNSKQKALSKAEKWYIEHTDYVNNLITDGARAVKPTGADYFHPELWKGIHWRWFLNPCRRD